MKFFFRFTALLALLLLVGLPVMAQTTASLTGSATTGGGPLPGVTVTISSPQMQGTRTAVTGDNGGYSFASIPPGEYDVKFELQGMATQTKKVRVGIGQQGRADADLKVSALTEAITVTAGAPTVLETATVSANVQQKLINALPLANRTPLGAAQLAPGVNANTPSGGQLSISGSPGYDNLVTVNGVAVTEEVRHQDLNLYIEDAIQETTVMTGAISAEYGGFTGGVVNSISKSGGNNFSGSVRDTLTNPIWTSLTPLQQTNKFQRVNDRSNVYEETLGGYIMRDRLWFFGAGRQANTSTTNALAAVPTSGSSCPFTPCLSDSTAASHGFTQSQDEKRYEGKLTLSPFAKVNIVGSYLDFKRQQQDTAFTLGSYDLAQLSGRSDPRKLKSIHADGVVTNNWMLEGLWSKLWWGVAWGNGSQFTDFINGTIVRNRLDGNNRYNSPTFCGVCDKETRSNDGYNFKSHYFLSNKGIGDHDIVVGGERFAEHRFANNYQSGSNFRVFSNGVQRINDVLYSTFNPLDPDPTKSGSAAFLQWTPIFSLQQNESDLASNAVFVNDRWNLNDHWSFGVGFRYDKNDATDASGTKVAKDARLSPRFNTTYDLKGDGRHRLTASFAHYASRIVEGPGTASASAGVPASIFFYYTGPAINPAGTPANQLVDTHAALAIIQQWLNSQCNAAGQCGVNNSAFLVSDLRSQSTQSVPGFDTVIDHRLKSPYVREMTIGYGTQWRPNMVTRIDLVARDWKAFYGFRVDQTAAHKTDPIGIVHNVAVVENTDDIHRRYRGAQFQGTWAPQRFNLGFNYTYSKLKGNDEQESATSGTVGNFPQSMYYHELTAYTQYQPEGYLVQDERSRLRAWIAYDIPMGHHIGALNVSLLQNYDSGQPYSAVQSIDIGKYACKPSATCLQPLLPADSTYSTQTTPTSYQYYFSDRGQYRLPNISSTDFSLMYRYPISRVELWAKGDLLNVFNRNSVALVNTTVNTAATSGTFATFNPFTTTPIECPQGTAAATCKSMGANFQKGANFGIPTNQTTGFQTPRSYRFAVGVRF